MRVQKKGFERSMARMGNEGVGRGERGVKRGKNGETKFSKRMSR